jgi:hypothetical protein
VDLIASMVRPAQRLWRLDHRRRIGVGLERAKVSHFSINERFGIHPPRCEEDADEKHVPAVVLPTQLYQLLQVLIFFGAAIAGVLCGGRLVTAPEPFLAALRGSDP